MRAAWTRADGASINSTTVCLPIIRSISSPILITPSTRANAFVPCRVRLELARPLYIENILQSKLRTGLLYMYLQTYGITSNQPMPWQKNRHVRKNKQRYQVPEQITCVVCVKFHLLSDNKHEHDGFVTFGRSIHQSGLHTCNKRNEIRKHTAVYVEHVRITSTSVRAISG